MTYKSHTFHARYKRRKATPEECALQAKVVEVRRQVIELDMWLRHHGDPFFNAEEGTTLDFEGWAVRSDNEFLAVVDRPHEFIEASRSRQV